MSLAIPHLAVEILSSDPASDLFRKFHKYAQAGLRRYWVIDPEGPELIVFQLGQRGGYEEIGRCGRDDTAEFDIGPAMITLRPGDLLR